MTIKSVVNTYSESEDYLGEFETAEGFVFIHLKIYKWNKSVLKKLRADLEQFLSEQAVKGHELVFIYTDNDKTLKMANMVKPLYEESIEIGQGYTVAAWETIGD